MAEVEKNPEMYIINLVIIKTLTEKMLPGYPVLKSLAVVLSEQNQQWYVFVNKSPSNGSLSSV